MNIGDKIKQERLTRNYTQEQLAELLNVSRSTVSSWEVNRNYPDLETIIAISDLFGISLDELLREDLKLAKETTKKMNRGKIYKHLLIAFSIIFVLYFGYNTKLRWDERTYRSNLEENGWVHPSTTSYDVNHQYEINENGINYWTYVLPAGLIGFPLPEQNISVITHKDNFIVYYEGDDKIQISISPENDESVSKQYYVNVDVDGELIENQTNLSKNTRKITQNYLAAFQDVHKELITQSQEKRQQIIEK